MTPSPPESGTAATIEALFDEASVTARVVPIPGARNLRDMGGYPTSDGRRVKRGLLFRSGHPGGIPAERIADLHALGLRGHVDLRTTGERARIAFPDNLVATGGQWTRDYDHSGGDITAVLAGPATDGEHMRRRMLKLYRGFPEEQSAGIAATFRLLLDGRVPFLINCSAGKDRTGVACALLLSTLGVPRDIVRRDYALTEVLHDPDGPLFQSASGLSSEGVRPDVWRALMRSDQAYLDATFAVIDEAYGSVERYVETAFGVGVDARARLRDLLLED